MRSNSTPWLLVLLAVLLIGGSGVTVYNQTRGLRNNNPGNLRRTKDNWAGLVATAQSDTAFFEFVSPEYGIRALAKTLKNYSSLYGLNTVAKLISRFAPRTENDTDAYIADVAGDLNVHPNEPINVEERLPQLIASITQHENGINPYVSGEIYRGIAMAA